MEIHSSICGSFVKSHGRQYSFLFCIQPRNMSPCDKMNLSHPWRIFLHPMKPVPLSQSVPFFSIICIYRYIHICVSQPAVFFFHSRSFPSTQEVFLSIFSCIIPHISLCLYTLLIETVLLRHLLRGYNQYILNCL